MSSVYTADLLTVRRKGATPIKEHLVLTSEDEPKVVEKEIRKGRFSVLALRLHRVTKTEQRRDDRRTGVTKLITTTQSEVVRAFKPYEARKWRLHDYYPSRQSK
jgi:hypothetical protein